MDFEFLDEYALKFLLDSTIPYHKGKDRIYDAVFRAHRDVLTGRWYLPRYCSALKSKTENPVDVLANYIRETKLVENENVIGSKELINYVQEKCSGVEFGAVQKLVNMSLKYIYLLSRFGENESFEDFKIDSTRFDCPLDSVILNERLGKNIKWTSMNKKTYDEVKTEITNKLSQEEKEYGNILFDFKYWNNNLK